MSLPSGVHVGPYTIISAIGKGGMGEVYRAKDERLGRYVAVKTLPEALVKNRDALVRFEREAKALAALNHPNILTIHDVGTDGDVSFVVMEFLEGETLRAHIGKSGMRCETALEIARAVAEGLSAAHSKGVIHRDLKPDNVFITKDHRVKILDFGLARWSEGIPAEELNELATASGDLTQSGALMGTVPYMSPEQVRAGRVDARSDIFSFGCMLYEMIAGTRPFARSTSAETVAAILKEEPQPLVQPEKVVPIELDHLIRHCLEKNPEERFQTTRDLSYALQEIQRSVNLLKTTASGSVSASRSHGRNFIWVTTIILVAILFALSYKYAMSGRETVDSLAVLPFVNASADPNMEYLSDGITESLINNLSQLPKLRILARTTVFTYRGKVINPQKVGSELNVRALLTGRLMREGDTLVIQADLVNTKDGSQIWGEQYNRQIKDIFALQAEIARDVTDKLRLKLTGAEQMKLTKRYTENTEAYQAYLKGRYYAAKYTEDGLKKGIDYFHQAIEVDPTYALAYAGISVAYWDVSNVQRAPRDVMPQAEEAALKSVEIDDNLAEAHASLGLVKMAYDWDRSTAEREYKRAIELNPGYAPVHYWHGWHLAIMGQTVNAIQELRRAQQLDPLSAEIGSGLGLTYFWAQKYDLATVELQKAVEIDPNFWWSHLLLGWTYLQEHKPTDALNEIQKAHQLDDNPWPVADLASALALSGKKDDAEKKISDLMDLSKKRYVSPYFLARVYTQLGEKEQAFVWLQKAFDGRDESLTWMKVDPFMNSLRSDLRYHQLLKELALPDN